MSIRKIHLFALHVSCSISYFITHLGFRQAFFDFSDGKDPQDSNIRIAPSYPTPEELKTATEIFVLSVKLVSIDKILEDK